MNGYRNPSRHWIKRHWLWITALILAIITQQVSAAIEFDLILHDVLITALPEQSGYQVYLYVSLLDEKGLPISNVQPDSFQVLEDSRAVNFKAEAAQDVSMSLVLVLDTSGSMAGEGIQNLRTAALRFVDQIEPEDRLAVLNFDNNVQVLSDFTQDKLTLKRLISNLQVTPRGGTCLYDAMYKAVQMSSLQQQGRRAVVVLTDGRDELADGSICSSMKMDDVIGIATNQISTPVYSIGIGKEVDENSLERVSLLTGGIFQKANDFEKLASTISTLQEQLTKQYLLSYTSNGAQGKHTISIETVIGETKDFETRTVIFPPPPPEVKILEPDDGSEIRTITRVKLGFSGNEAMIKVIQYELNGKLSSEDRDRPFDEFVIDPTSSAPGDLTLTVKALDEHNNLLSSDVIHVMIPQSATVTPASPTDTPTLSVANTTTPAPGNTATQEPTPTPQTGGGGTIGPWLLGGGIGLILVAAILAVVFLKPFRKQEPAYTPAPETFIDMTMPTMDSLAIEPSSNAFASLTLLESEDKDRKKDEVLSITQLVTQLGRSKSNDLVFKDATVSRNHAVIEWRDNQFWLSEALTGDETSMKAPKFGTFINSEKITGLPMPLKTGDEIRLGKVLTLRFEILQAPPASTASNISDSQDLTHD